MADYIYVDNSNLYIEGRRASAVANGLAGDMREAIDIGIFDHGYTISFGKLHEFLTGNDLGKIRRVALFGSRPPPNDSIWVHAEHAASSSIWRTATSRTRRSGSTPASRRC